METINIKAETRTETGKKANKALRKTGRIPAVLYGGKDTHTFSTTIREVKHLIYTPNFKLAELDIDGAKHKAIVKEIQFHPVTDAIEHIDFIKLQEGVPVKVQVPVRFKGTSPGVREGGKLIQSIRNIGIKTTPENLVDELVADISHVTLGMAVRVKDLEVSDDIEVMSPGNIPVASVNVPRALKSVEEEEAEVAEAAEVAAEGEAAADGDAEAPKE